MPNKNAGFTLIELVVVIIILGVLAVVAAPKFINIQSDAYKSQLSGAQASMKSAVTLFKAKSEIANSGTTNRVVYDGIRGENYQPWAASASGTAPSAAYTTPPEIFKAAGLNVDEWSYRIHTTGGTYQVIATPKQKLNLDTPTQAQVKATNCYIDYKWETTGIPTYNKVDTGC
ncbi:prepilin-type N-terminal cleavage/methylation domain-containing protein [Shewanella baltica]|uniref:type II secretion system protein n=1 Tax=Shewanella baltica TaxID=62322 RepID=UPI00217DBB24|nr:prepilin-type N-terminal cleavage/methylation domain-containing protein [Shewanella baltica]MCS6120110.1 prepilin-type N-terminal cleavage/methylation domain-containing protein [Shewanella baltica]